MLIYLSNYILYGPKNMADLSGYLLVRLISLVFPLFIYSILSSILSVCLASLAAVGTVMFSSLEMVVMIFKYLITSGLTLARNTPEISCLFHYEIFLYKEL